MITKTAIDQVHEALAGHASPTRVWLVGAPWFEPPAEIIAGMRLACSGVSFPYPPPLGLEDLRLAVCELHAREGLDLAAERVVITHGAKGGLTCSFGCLLDNGNELMHPTPGYPAYATIARALGAVPVAIAVDDGGFSLTTAKLEQHLTPKTRALVLSSPSNPTGSVLNAEQSRVAVEFCRRHGLRLIFDEAYSAFGPVGDSHRGPAGHDPSLETVVLVRSFSKVFAVCGWRIGYIAADADFVRAVARWQSAMLNPPNWIAQRSLVAAPGVPPETLTHNRDRVRSRLETLAQVLTDAGLPVNPPEGGFYLWIDLRPTLAALGGPSSLDFCTSLARREGIGLWPGEDFQSPGFVRVSAVSCPEESWCDAVAHLSAGIRRFLAWTA